MAKRRNKSARKKTSSPKRRARGSKRTRPQTPEDQASEELDIIESMTSGVADISFASDEVLRSGDVLRSDDVVIQEIAEVELEDPNSDSEDSYLNEFGLPIPHRNDNDKRARTIFADLRETCRGCSYRRICSFAPVALHVQRTISPKARHVHTRYLRHGLKKLVTASPTWYITLLNIMAEREHDGHLAGCLLAEAWRKYPDRMAELLDEVTELTQPLLENRATIDSRGHAQKLQPGQGIDPRMLQAQVFRGQLVRAASFLEEEELFACIHDALEFIPDEDGRLYQHEVVAALTLFITDDVSAKEWVEELQERAPEPFRATFAWKLFEEDIIALFFPYRRGRKRSYIYVMRNEEGREFITSIDKQPINEVLENLFAVFDTDEKKTYRIFKEICRHINVRAGKYNADLILEGFEQLEREQLLLLSIYAPALARAIGHYLQLPHYDTLIKFLYKLRAESERRGQSTKPSHQKVFQQRQLWNTIRQRVGDKDIRDFFKMLFRLNASYIKSVYTTNTFIKLGEVAYLLTALSGWNPKGLDLELNSRKPLAYIAYGLQPPDKFSAIRTRKFSRVMDRYEEDESLWRSLELGGRYMALLHDVESFEDLLALAQKNDDIESAKNESREKEPQPELMASAEEAYSEDLESDDDEASDLYSDDDLDLAPPAPRRRSGTGFILGGPKPKEKQAKHRKTPSRSSETRPKKIKTQKSPRVKSSSDAKLRKQPPPKTKRTRGTLLDSSLSESDVLPPTRKKPPAPKARKKPDPSRSPPRTSKKRPNKGRLSRKTRKR